MLILFTISMYTFIHVYLVFVNLFNCFHQYQQFWQMKLGLAVLPMDVWADVFVYPWITRKNLAQIVDQFKERQFAEKLQTFLHDPKCGKHSLGHLQITCKLIKNPSKYQMRKWKIVGFFTTGNKILSLARISNDIGGPLWLSIQGLQITYNRNAGEYQKIQKHFNQVGKKSIIVHIKFFYLDMLMIKSLTFWTKSNHYLQTFFSTSAQSNRHRICAFYWLICSQCWPAFAGSLAIILASRFWQRITQEHWLFQRRWIYRLKMLTFRCIWTGWTHRVCMDRDSWTFLLNQKPFLPFWTLFTRF